MLPDHSNSDLTRRWLVLLAGFVLALRRTRHVLQLVSWYDSPGDTLSTGDLQKGAEALFARSRVIPQIAP